MLASVVKLCTQVTEHSDFKVGAYFVPSLMPWRLLIKKLKIIFISKIFKFCWVSQHVVDIQTINAFTGSESLIQTPPQQELTLHLHRDFNVGTHWCIQIASPLQELTLRIAREQTETTNFLSFGEYLYLKPKWCVPE